MAPQKRKPAAPSPHEAKEASGKTSLDVEALRAVVELLEASDVTHLSWRRGEERLVVHRGHNALPLAPVMAPSAQPSVTVSAPRQAPAAVVPAPAAVPVAVAAAEKPGQLVTSPFVGTFYRTPAPDQPSFVEMGSVVKKGQVLCIVEAMKLMNEIEADVAGTIIEVLAQNGQAVEFGQSLFRIDPL